MGLPEILAYSDWLSLAMFDSSVIPFLWLEETEQCWEYETSYTKKREQHPCPKMKERRIIFYKNE